MCYAYRCLFVSDVMSPKRLSLPAMIFLLAVSTPAISETLRPATHTPAYPIQPSVEGKKLRLESFCLGPRGNVWMACREISSDSTPDRGFIMVYDPSGLLFDSFPISLVPQAITFSTNNRLYVAGQGKVARLALNGTVEVETNLIALDSPDLTRVLRSTAIAATDNEVFIARPELKGDGMGIWRYSPDLTLEGKVISDVAGCKGQLDIQTDGEHLIVAENTKFEVVFYDRFGKRLKSFGKRSDSTQDGFSSPCNPMNIRCQPNGEILTAEAPSGQIKRFDRHGSLLSYVGSVKLTENCTDLAIEFDPARNLYYMMDEAQSQVAVLYLKEEAPEEPIVESADRTSAKQ